MWEDKVIIWCLSKYSKQEFEVSSANENDIITARKHALQKLRLWKELEMFSNTSLQRDMLLC